MKFIQARYYREGSPDRPIDWIVLHDMEAPEKATTAETVALYFTHPASPSSAHYCVDSDSVVQCVREQDIAFHAPPNDNSIGIEHAGYARQTRNEWLDAYGSAMLVRSARLVAELCAKYDVPLVYVNADDLKAGKRGITMHRDVSAAFRQSTHTDPGEHFPIHTYMALVRRSRRNALPTWFKRELRLTKPRMTGPDVRALQYRIGAPVVTGKYGLWTAAAMKRWQRRNDLPITGVFTKRDARHMGGSK